MHLALPVLLAAWIGTWAAAPSGLDANASFGNVTLREVVHTTIGGSAIRVRLTNRFGDAPLIIAAVTIAPAQSSATAGAASVPRALTFAGAPSVTIPAHADVVSESLTQAVAAQSDLVVSIYLAGSARSPTYHHLAYQDSFSAAGNHVADVSAASFTTHFRNWYFLAGVDVSGSAARGAVVALGDSITNGQGSTIDGDNRWSDDLAQRLLALPPAQQHSVLNEAIDGDRILLDSLRFGPSALARFDTDVLAQSGVTDVIILLGINDIQQTPHQYDPKAIEFGLRQLVLRAHAHGIRAIGCTITPYGGWMTYADAGDRARNAVNAFIRSSGIFDGVADFDAVVRDPSAPNRLASGYDSGDHLHPNAAAYTAMAAAVDLSRL